MIVSGIKASAPKCGARLDSLPDLMEVVRCRCRVSYNAMASDEARTLAHLHPIAPP